MTHKSLILDDLLTAQLLFGKCDELIKPLESALNVSLNPKENTITIEGKEHNIEQAEKILQIMYDEVKNGKFLSIEDLGYLIQQVKSNGNLSKEDLKTGTLTVSKNGKVVKAKSTNQQKYIRTIQERDLTFGIGPAGTGKTYLAVAMGILGLKENLFKRLILTRPVVEAGESLGFLPGDLHQKINPYLRPLFDAILDMIPFEEFTLLKEKEIIEIVPLAYMRGRTLNNAFIILDEAQNTTITQMKMFLTRMGASSKMVITGDLTQVDLPKANPSGLIFVNQILAQVKEIGFVYFKPEDIVRHPLVGKILAAFERNNK